MASSWRGAADTPAWSRPSSLATTPSLRSPESDVAPVRSPGGLFGEVALSLYGAAGWIGLPVASAFLAWRARQGKEDADRRGERLGNAALERPAGPLVWLHAASVGETVSAVPLIRRLHALRPTVLLTTGTVTAADVAKRRLRDAAMHQFVPIDCPTTMARFLDHWRPDLALWVESELWPNLVLETARRRVPMLLVNARMSERSAQRWRRVPKLIAPLLESFHAVLAQSAADAERFAALGARRVVNNGNLKFDAPPLPCDENTLAELHTLLGDRPLWLAASTHPGEEAVVVAAHRALRGEVRDLLVIIVPRHPERGPDLARELAARGMTPALRSRGERPTSQSGVYVADTLGELGLFYRLAHIVFIGGSIEPHGGHNPVEPALLDCALIAGPHMENFAESCTALERAGGLERVIDAADLQRLVADWLHDPTKCAGRAAAAKAAAHALTGAADRALREIAGLLPQQQQGEQRARA